MCSTTEDVVVVVFFFRSVVGSVIYGWTSAHDTKHPTRLTVYFIAGTYAKYYSFNSCFIDINIFILQTGFHMLY